MAGVFIFAVPIFIGKRPPPGAPCSQPRARSRNRRRGQRDVVRLHVAGTPSRFNFVPIDRNRRRSRSGDDWKAAPSTTPLPSGPRRRSTDASHAPWYRNCSSGHLHDPIDTPVTTACYSRLIKETAAGIAARLARFRPPDRGHPDAHGQADPTSARTATDRQSSAARVAGSSTDVADGDRRRAVVSRRCCVDLAAPARRWPA